MTAKFGMATLRHRMNVQLKFHCSAPIFGGVRDLKPPLQFWVLFLNGSCDPFEIWKGNSVTQGLSPVKISLLKSNV